MREALKGLDKEIKEPMKLLIGGGAAFILAHRIPLTTMDMDAIPFQSKMTIGELDPCVKKVAAKLQLPKDWLNHYFATFTYSLPKDYGERLVSVYQGKHLHALALGKEDLLIMKCFAGREKDRPHARALLKKGVRLPIVKEHLHYCLKENLPNAQKALDCFYELCDQLGIDA